MAPILKGQQNLLVCERFTCPEPPAGTKCLGRPSRACAVEYLSGSESAAVLALLSQPGSDANGSELVLHGHSVQEAVGRGLYGDGIRSTVQTLHRPTDVPETPH